MLTMNNMPDERALCVLSENNANLSPYIAILLDRVASTILIAFNAEGHCVTFNPAAFKASARARRRNSQGRVEQDPVRAS